MRRHGFSGLSLLACVCLAAGVMQGCARKTAARTAAERDFRRGQKHFEQGDYHNAIAAFTFATAVDPGYWRPYYWRGMSHELTNDRITEENGISAVHGDRAKAIEDYTKAISLNPDFADLYRKRASVYYHTKAYDLALADYTMLIELQPDYDAYGMRASTHLKLGNPALAAADRDKAVELWPDNWAVYMCRAGHREKTGDLVGATEDYDKAIALCPAMFRLYDMRADIYEKRGLHGKAVDDYTRAIELSPQYAPRYIYRGLAYAAAGEHDNAIADYTRSIDRCPNARAYTLRGKAFLDHRRDFEGGIADFSAVLESNPDDARVHWMRGMAYASRAHSEKNAQDWDRALEDFDTAIEIAPEHSIVYLSRAGLYRDGLKDYNRALADCSSAIALDADDGAAYIMRASVHHLMGDLDSALSDYTRAAELAPGRAYPYLARGKVYAEKGQNQLASDDLERAAALDPDGEVGKEARKQLGLLPRDPQD
ncbi:MAG: tetratricopeptide repeat protein [Planctomycetota bacterium]